MFYPLGKTQNNLSGVASIPHPSCTLELKKASTGTRLFRLAKQQLYSCITVFCTFLSRFA